MVEWPKEGDLDPHAVTSQFASEQINERVENENVCQKVAFLYGASY